MTVRRPAGAAQREAMTAFYRAHIARAKAMSMDVASKAVPQSERDLIEKHIQEGKVTSCPPGVHIGTFHQKLAQSGETSGGRVPSLKRS